MRKLSVVEFLSLDGVYQGPGGPDEDRSGGFDKGGWVMPYNDDVFFQHAAAGMAESDATLLGRKTYEIFASYWPHQPLDDPFSKHLNTTQKYVVSKTLDRPEWEGTTALRTVEEVAEVKQQEGGTISVMGSGELVRSLLEADLVDELSLLVVPLVLGSGKRLFTDTADVKRFTLAGSKPTTTGAVLLTYHREGA